MKWYGKYGRRARLIDKRFGKYGRKLWRDMENMGQKSRLNSEMIWNIQKKIVKRYRKYGTNVSWNVKWYGKYGRKASLIEKKLGKYGRKLRKDMENMEEQ